MKFLHVLASLIGLHLAGCVGATGNEMCPCVEPPALSEAELTSAAANSTGLTAAELQEYGNGCAAHDVNRSICTTVLPDECKGRFPSPPECQISTDWCAATWCYIDRDACGLTHRNTDDPAFRGAGPLQLNLDRDYSYATCGSAQTPFSGDALTTALQGVELRVAFCANTGGWLGSYPNSGSAAAQYFNGTVGWSGPAVDFFRAVQLAAGFTVLQVEVPQEAIDAAGGTRSAFTRCSYATSMGFVDVCVGDFSITSYRNELTSFYTVDNVGIWLVTFAKPDDDSASQLALVFSPFQGEVWVCLFAQLFLIGLVIAVQEYFTQVLAARRRVNFDESSPEADHTSVRRADSAQPTTLSALNTEWNGAEFHDVGEMLIPRGDLPSASKKEVAIHVGQSIFVALQSFASASGPTTLISSWGGQFSVLALCWLVTISVATYTGEMAALFTTMKATATTTSSMAEIIADGIPICGSRGTLVAAAAVYPSAVYATDPVDGLRGQLKRSDIFKLMDAGTCGAALIPLQDLEKEQSSAPPRQCNKIAVEEVMGVGRGFPLAESYARQLAWAMQNGNNVGDYELSKQRFKQEQKCSGNDALSDESYSARGLNVSQMSGLFISVFFILSFGILLSLIGCCTTIGGPSVYAKARTQRKKLLNNKRVRALRSKNVIRTAERASVINPYKEPVGTGTSTF